MLLKRHIEDYIQFICHFLVMAAVPVDFAAAFALLEPGEIFFGERQEAVDDSILFNLGQQAVAGDAAGKGLELVLQGVEVDDFSQLLLGILAADQMAEYKLALLEQISVSREKDAVLANGSRDGIGIVTAYCLGVNPGHSQQAGQSADVDIHQKYAGGKRLRAEDGGHGRREGW